MNSDNSVGVIVGRFQIDEMHNGHFQLIETVYRRHTEVLLVLGCTDTPANSKDPLDFLLRKQMFRDAGYQNMVIVPIYNQPSDKKWSADLDKIIQTKCSFSNKDQVILYGGRNSFIEVYSGIYSAEVINFNVCTSASQRRHEIKNRYQKGPLGTPFRAGVIHAITNLTPRVFVTVDLAIINDKNEILLGQHKGEDRWRFPGGFVKLEDPTFEKAAQRILNTKTGITHVGYNSFKYLGSYTINDWRSKGHDDIGHKTVLFGYNTHISTYKAGDNLEDLRFFSFELDDEKNIFRHIVQEHLDLLTRTVSFLLENGL